jgi:hypothetical protein
MTTFCIAFYESYLATVYGFCVGVRINKRTKFLDVGHASLHHYSRNPTFRNQFSSVLDRYVGKYAKVYMLIVILYCISENFYRKQPPISLIELLIFPIMAAYSEKLTKI